MQEEIKKKMLNCRESRYRPCRLAVHNRHAAHENDQRRTPHPLLRLGIGDVRLLERQRLREAEAVRDGKCLRLAVIVEAAHK